MLAKVRNSDILTSIKSQKWISILFPLRNSHSSVSFSNTISSGNSSSGDQPASANNPEPSGLLIAETEENRELRQVIREALIKKATPEDLQAHIAAIKSKDRKQMHIGIIALRKALSIGI